MSEKGERLDPRVRRTRGLIVDAFNAMLAEKSFEEVTVGDIAERATVNRATFYAHFHDKYALLDYSMDGAFRRMLHGKLGEDARLNPETLKRLVLVVCSFLTDVHGQCGKMQRQFESLMETKIKDVMRDLLLEWIRLERKPLRGGADPEMAATVASWAIYGAVLQWSRGKKRPPAEEFARDILPLVTASLGQAVALQAS